MARNVFYVRKITSNIFKPLKRVFLGGFVVVAVVPAEGGIRVVGDRVTTVITFTVITANDFIYSVVSCLVKMCEKVFRNTVLESGEE